MRARMSLKTGKMVMAVAVLGLAMNQGAFSQAPPCTSFDKSITAYVSTAGNSANVAPDRACLAKRGTMKWTATDGETWSTDFADDAHSPFIAGRTHHAGKVGKTSGDRVRACSKNDATYDGAAGGCVFKYKAAHVKGGATSTIDPQVVVQPGT